MFSNAVYATAIADPISPTLPMNKNYFEGGQRQGFYSLSFASPRLEKKGGVGEEGEGNFPVVFSDT